MYVIFGLDIDDCLATEYFLYPNDTGYGICFTGDIYSDIKQKIETIKAHHPHAVFIISTYSARGTSANEVFNSTRNCTIFSVQLLFGLAKQLADELRIEIMLDQSWLADILNEHPAFNVGLTDPMALFTHKEYSSRDILKKAIEQNLATKDERLCLNNDRLMIKLLRVRQILQNWYVHYKAIGDVPIKLFLYDDRIENLTVIQDYFFVYRANFMIYPILNNPYYMVAPEYEVLLDRNALHPLESFSAGLSDLRALKAGFKRWVLPIANTAMAGFLSVTEKSADLVVPERLVQKIENDMTVLKAKLDRDIRAKKHKGPSLRGNLISKEKTLLRAQTPSGCSWGKHDFPPYPEKVAQQFI